MRTGRTVSDASPAREDGTSWRPKRGLVNAVIGSARPHTAPATCVDSDAQGVRRSQQGNTEALDWTGAAQT